MAHAATSRADASFSGFGALKSGLASLQDAFHEYRRRRAVYARTMRELQSYRPHELRDLGIGTADFATLAAQQAGLTSAK